jgi:hypothetical protein
LDSISSTKKKKKQEVGKGPKWNFSKDREWSINTQKDVQHH